VGEIITLADRFWRHVERATEDECWLWTGAVQRGYGAVRLSLPGATRRQVNAQRVAFVLTYGPINAEDHVLHRCDTPLCCNPRHLFVGDRSANMADAARKGRMSRPGTRAANPEQILEVRRLIEEGGTNRGIAAAAGVAPVTVRRYRRMG
jgi:hypothetical protein